MNTENRFIDLEIKVAHLEKNLEELGDVVYKQQQEIRNLEQKLENFIKRSQSNTNGELEIRGPNEKPPHY
jgi:SlyX protein